MVQTGQRVIRIILADYIENNAQFFVFFDVLLKFAVNLAY
jgi:hypothetical protein